VYGLAYEKKRDPRLEARSVVQSPRSILSTQGTRQTIGRIPGLPMRSPRDERWGQCRCRGCEKRQISQWSPEMAGSVGRGRPLQFRHGV